MVIYGAAAVAIQKKNTIGLISLTKQVKEKREKNTK